jgi:hypothetical protein
MDKRTGCREAWELGRFFVLKSDDAAGYVRQLAWLAATPDTEDAPRYKKYDGLPIAEPEPETGTEYIMAAMREVGFYFNTGSGPTPLPWSEIRAWMSSTSRQGIALASTIRFLSEQYVSEYFAASDPMRPAPLSDDNEQQIARDQVADRMRKLAGG